MKRELKDFVAEDNVGGAEAIARPIPMKRELKGAYRLSQKRRQTSIARPIPMKRELKVLKFIGRSKVCRSSQGPSR